MSPVVGEVFAVLAPCVFIVIVVAIWIKMVNNLRIPCCKLDDVLVQLADAKPGEQQRQGREKRQISDGAGTAPAARPAKRPAPTPDLDIWTLRLFTKGLPLMSEMYARVASWSKRSDPQTHKPAAFVAQEFRVQNACDIEAIKQTAQLSPSLTLVTWSQIVNSGMYFLCTPGPRNLFEKFISTYLDDLCGCAFKFEAKPLRCGLSLSKSGDDAIFVMQERITRPMQTARPIFVVQVRQPESDCTSEQLLTHPKALGQLYDYLRQVQSYYGQVEVFGLVTDLMYWRLCWLPEADALALATDGLTAPAGVLPVPTAVPRDLHGVEALIHHTDHRLAHVIVAAVVKSLHRAQVHPVALLGSDRLYVQYTPKSWKWTRLVIPAGVTAATLALPKGRTHYLALRHFYIPYGGLVFLVTTPTLNVAVLKMFYKEANRNQEARLWRSLWDVHVLKQTLNGFASVIMPFCFTVQQEHVAADDSWRPYFDFDLQRQLCMVGVEQINSHEYVSRLQEQIDALSDKPTPQQAARAAIAAIAERGYKHEDADWRHVGLLPVLSPSGDVIGLKPVLIDMAHVSPLGDLDKNQAIDEMIRYLEQDV